MNIDIIKMVVGGLVCVAAGMAINWQSAKPNGASPAPPNTEKLFDFVSFAGRAAGVLFWSFYWWDHFHPENIGGPAKYVSWLLVVAVGVAHPLGLPVLLARVFPKDPWHQYLQEQVKESKSEKILLWTTIIWSFASGVMIVTWAGQALGVTNKIDLLLVTVTLIVVTVMIPSFAMLQEVPKHWKAIADMVSDLELRRRQTIAEQIEIEAHLQRALILLTMDPLQMTLDQRQNHNKEIADILAPVFIRVNESSRVIINLIGSMMKNKDMSRFLARVDDKDIYERLDRVLEMQTNVANFRIEEPQPVEKKKYSTIFQ